MALAIPRNQSRHGHTPREQDPRKHSTARLILEVLLLATICGWLPGCATSGVTKETGRKMDPPAEVIFYCLLFPFDPACRILKK